MAINRTRSLPSRLSSRAASASARRRSVAQPRGGALRRGTPRAHSAIPRNSQPCALRRSSSPFPPLQVAEFIHRGVQIAKEVNASGIGKKLADFKAALNEKPYPAIEKLAADVAQFAAQFPCVGFDETTMKYKDVRRPDDPHLFVLTRPPRRVGTNFNAPETSTTFAAGSDLSAPVRLPRPAFPSSLRRLAPVEARLPAPLLLLHQRDRSTRRCGRRRRRAPLARQPLRQRLPQLVAVPRGRGRRRPSCTSSRRRLRNVRFVPAATSTTFARSGCAASRCFAASFRNLPSSSFAAIPAARALRSSPTLSPFTCVAAAAAQRLDELRHMLEME